MNYSENFFYLKKHFSLEEDFIELKECNLQIINIPFKSESYKILPGEESYENQGIQFPRTPDYQNAISPEINEFLNLADSKVYENKNFTYSVFKPAKEEKVKNIIILFHGFNEKTWTKYLPWATKLVESTGRAVVLMPIAFHINRAPADWSNYRMMNDLKYIRESLFPAIVSSSFANVAISTRLHILPQRFFWSGLQTFYDVIQLIKEIRSGLHPIIDADAGINFFAYSIGAFLIQILMMENSEGYFSDSKLFIFCGGPVFNRMSPVRKAILDSEADIALYSFFLEQLESYLKKDKRLAHYFGHSHPEGFVFKSMLDYNKMREFREDKLAGISDRIFAIALKKDHVVPSYEVINTLQGAGRNIPVKVKVMDFPYKYSHETPFPVNIVNKSIRNDVNRCFEKVFNEASEFLK